MTGELLPDFQNFLLLNKVIRQKKAPYYAYWVSKFLDFSNYNGDLPFEIQKKKFLTILSGQKNIEEWQVKQAQQAIH